MLRSRVPAFPVATGLLLVTIASCARKPPIPTVDMNAIAERYVTSEVEFAQATGLPDHLPPGPGSLVERYAEFRDRHVIPRDKLDAVFQAGISACLRGWNRRIGLEAWRSDARH